MKTTVGAQEVNPLLRVQAAGAGPEPELKRADEPGRGSREGESGQPAGIPGP